MGCASSNDAYSAPQELVVDEEAQKMIANLTSRKVGVDDFELGVIVGEGAYSRVCIAKLKDGSYPDPFVLKVLRKHDVIKLKQVKKVQSERSVLAMMTSPFVVKLLTTFQDEDRLYILMPFVNGGELFDLMAKERQLTPQACKLLIAELIESLIHIHSHKVVFRDIKLENVLLDHRGHLRVVDFGFAKQVTDKTYTVCGSPEYIAPEIIEGRGYQLTPDWWALGIVFYRMACGKFPFKSAKKGESWSTVAFQRIISEKIEFPETGDTKLVDAIQKFLTKDSTKRVGCTKPLGADEGAIRKIGFFSDLDWKKVQTQGYTMPHIPEVADARDTSKFSGLAKATNMNRITNTPNIAISIMDQELFEGWGPTAPGSMG